MHKKAVVIGLGIGRQHVRLIDAAPGLHLYGVCDLVEQRRNEVKAEFPQVKLFADFDDVLSDPEVDLVTLALPHHLHAPMAIAAMQARKHVVLEKPMCLSLEEARELIEVRDKTKMVLTVFHNRRWDADFLTLRRAIERGLIGKILHLETNITWHGAPGGWRVKRKQMGGWMFNWGAHLLDQACLLISSKPKSVFAVQHFNPAHKQEVEDFIRALVAFEDGTSMSVTVSQMCRLPMTRFFVLGAEGTLSYRSGERTCELRREINRLPVTLHPDPLKGDSQEFYNNLGEVLTGGANLLVTPEQTLPMIAIAQAAHLSAARRRLVTIRELGGL